MIRLIDILKELSYSFLYNKTPDTYKDRARDVRVKLKTITRKGQYHYQTTTTRNGHVHEQWIQPRPGKFKIKSANDNIILWCDCEDFTYENEWLLWKNNTSRVVNSNGQPLKIRNPEKTPKLCKHLVAVLGDFKNRVKR